MIKALAEKTKNASLELATVSSEIKNEALLIMAEDLEKSFESVLIANSKDLKLAKEKGMSPELQDRLALNKERVFAMANGLRQVMMLDDPIGEVTDTFKNSVGLKISQVRVPLGLIAMIYESRPNVTVDATALAIKSGNGIILRGSSSAYESNMALVEILKNALRKTSLSPDIINYIDLKERSVIKELLSLSGIIDLAIPRGGSGLIQHVLEVARVPVIETGVGNCHIYVDKYANLEMAKSILLNGKTQRPSVCNALETLLVHKDIANDFYKKILPELKSHNVDLYGCENSMKYDDSIYKATEEEYKKEFLALKLACRQVDSLAEAISHIKKYSSGHSEVIVTDSIFSANQFTSEIDSACVYVNASTRFSDGEQFGFGAEIGISTQKMHSRGPMGLKALTGYKYIIWGNGQIRQ